MIPNDYPSRTSVPKPGDKHLSTGKGPTDDEVKGAVAPVDTKGMVHDQVVGPTGQTHKPLPNTGKTQP